MSKRKDVLILRTYEVHWLNHSQYALSMQYVAEDLMFDSIATSRKAFSVVDDLDYSEACLIKESSGSYVMIIRSNDMRIPID